MAKIGDSSFAGWVESGDGFTGTVQQYQHLEPSPGQDGDIVLFGGTRGARVDVETIGIYETIGDAAAGIAAYKAMQTTNVTVITPVGSSWPNTLVLRVNADDPMLDAIGQYVVRARWELLTPEEPDEPEEPEP